MKKLFTIFMLFFVVTAFGQRYKEISSDRGQSLIECTKKFEKIEKFRHNLEKEDFGPIKQHQNPIYPNDKDLLKSNKGNMRLDSIYRYDFESELDSVLSSKEVYSYNADGNMTFWARYNWDINNQVWVGFKKYEYEYDAEGNRTLYITYNWDTNDELWVADWKYEYEYDADGNMTLCVVFNWHNDDQVWIGISKYEWEYDAVGNITLYLEYYWYNDNQVWVKYWKEEYEYDADGNRTFYIRYFWETNNEEWIKASKYEYEYDTGGNMTLSVEYNWDINNQVWIVSSKAEYEYDADGNRTLQAEYNWDINNQLWIGDWKVEFEYDSEGKMTLRVRYNWDSNDELWIADWKYEYEYDADGSRSLSAYYNWDINNQLWVGDWKEEFEYDSEGRMTLSVFYYWDSNTWIINRKFEYEYDSEGNMTFWANYNWDNDNQLWIIDWKSFYYYSETFTIFVNIEPADAGSVTGEGTYSEGKNVTLEASANEGFEFVNWTDSGGEEVHSGAEYTFTMPAHDVTLTANFTDDTGIEDITSTDVSVFPNPSRNKFTVESSEMIKRIILLDINGQVVSDKTVGGLSYEINVNELPTGMYFIQIHTNAAVLTGKVQVAR